jgi:hypothetical protein
MRLMQNLSRPIITEPFNSLWNLIHEAESRFYRLRHEVSHHIPVDASGCGHIAHHFPVTAVHGKSHPNAFPVPARDLKNIAAPALIAPMPCNRAVMEPHRSTRIALEEQVIHLHDTVDPFMVHPAASLSFQNAVQDRRHPAISIRGPIINDLPEEGQADIISGLPVTLTRLFSLLILVGSGYSVIAFMGYRPS